MIPTSSSLIITHPALQILVPIFLNRLIINFDIKCELSRKPCASSYLQHNGAGMLISPDLIDYPLCSLCRIIALWDAYASEPVRTCVSFMNNMKYQKKGERNLQFDFLLWPMIIPECAAIFAAII